MRIDAFLNAVNLVKRRAIAQDMIAHNAVLINGAVVKASREVKTGDIIELRLLNKNGEPFGARYEAIAIPATRSVAKSLQSEYVKEIK